MVLLKVSLWKMRKSTAPKCIVSSYIPYLAICILKMLILKLNGSLYYKGHTLPSSTTFQQHMALFNSVQDFWFSPFFTWYLCHSSEIRGLHSTQCSSETIQNLLFFMYRKTCIVFLFFILCNFTFFLMNALIYVDIDQGIHMGKSKVAWNEKWKKLRAFSYT